MSQVREFFISKFQCGRMVVLTITMRVMKVTCGIRLVIPPTKSFITSLTHTQKTRLMTERVLLT